MTENTGQSQDSKASEDNSQEQARTDKALVDRAVALAGQEWADIARLPVSDKSPAGENIRLEPLFEQIEAEIAKLDSLTNDTPVEWDLMVQWCRDILKNESKDILVACYLSRALCESNLLQGLVTGALINILIAQTFWDNGFPPKKRARGRAAAYNWWVEQCAPLIEKVNFNTGQLENLGLLLSLLDLLDLFLAEQLREEAPGFNELVQPLKRQKSALEAEKHAQTRKKEQASKPQAAPAPAPRESGTSQTAAAPVTVAAGSVGTDRDLQNCYRSVQDALRGACEFLRAGNLANPEPYRINRFITWLGVSQLPPNTNGVTQLRPPPKEKLQHYESLQSSGSFRELVPELETSLSKAPYWISGQRIVHEALQELGYKESAEAVVEGVKSFVSRFPNVTELKFSDQTEFADAATRQWLQLEVFADSAGGASHSLPVTGGDGNEWEQAYEEAMQLFRDKKNAEAFAVFRDGCRQAFSQRSLAFWRYYQARFCFETRHTDLTIALLESVQKDLQERGYDEWEPEISAKVIELLIRAYQQQTEKEIPRNRVAALHERLCQFDLATAYELSIN